MREWTSWRYVETWGAPGAYHMALDEAMARLVGEGKLPPTLRLYTWQPSTLSLGMHQKLSRSIDAEVARLLGIGIVRRPSGGRTVFHDMEITYSIILPESMPGIPRSIREAFRLLTQGLVQAYHLLGITQARLHESLQTDEKRVKHDSPVCFEEPGESELVIDGKKAAGSAQARLYGALLQHGSVPLRYDEEKMFRLFYFPDDATREKALRRFQKTATSIEAALGRTVAPETLQQALREGFARAFDIEFIEGNLTDEENRLTEKLIAEKYGTDAWTNR